MAEAVLYGVHFVMQKENDMRSIVLAIMAAAVAACGAFAGEVPLESRIVSVGLFKNGLALVKREVTAPKEGSYLVGDVPDAVHGAFWIESEARIEALSTTRDQELPALGVDLQTELAGKTVTIHFRDGQIPVAKGVVVALKPDGKAWDRTYERESYSRYPWYYSPPPAPSQPAPAQAPRYLVLETKNGRAYIEPGMIAYAESDGQPAKVMRPRPVLVLTVAEAKNKPCTISITYLAKGLSWAPSYRVDITKQDQMTLEQNAVIRNELESFADAELYLITGFPSVQFSHVVSPLSARATWANFFQQLAMQPSQPGGNRAVTAQMVMSNSAAPDTGIDLSATPSGEGPDLHYQPIGKRSLAEADSLALTVASAQAKCERIIEWIVPDIRDAYGRPSQDNDRSKDDAAPWDAVTFANPLPFPMTTGPASVMAANRLLGQQMTFFTNKGEQATVHITKALSVRTRAMEQEEKGEREIVVLGWHDFRKVRVKGELTINNHRNEAIKVVAKRRFSGNLVDASDNPKEVLLEEGVYSVNERTQLTWTFNLKPGEERTFSYKYTVLVSQ